MRELAVKLAGQNWRLFRLLTERIPTGSGDEEAERVPTLLDETAARHLRNIRRIGSELSALLSEQLLLARYHGSCAQARFALSRIREQAGILENYESLVYWLEQPNGDLSSEERNSLETLLCAIPKQLSDLLYKDLWSGSIPVILTSGTLPGALPISNARWGLTGCEI